MSLTLQEQDCRNSIIYFEMLLRMLENGETPNAIELHTFRKQIEKLKKTFEVKNDPKTDAIRIC